MTEKAYTSLEDQYQTVNIRRTKEEITSSNTVEEILKKIVPAKSFLYRNQDKKNDRIFSSYLPMDSGTPKKPRKFFRMSSYEYPMFSSKVTKTENYNDRGYYSVKTNSRYYIQKTFKIPEARSKYKSINTPEEVSDSIVEDHLYEDLCYNDVEKTDPEKKDQTQKPYKVKIQELFQSFKLPFFKKNDEDEKDEVKKEGPEVVVQEKKEAEGFYENGDIDVAVNMYDSVQAVRPVEANAKDRDKIPVEDYLEPIQVDRERQYCDVALREDSLLQYIMNLFENFGKRETNDENSEDSDTKKPSPEAAPAPEWSSMAGRPLPVPVESEPYYMRISRSEAEDLLRGEPDGVFLLRPSSQPNHAYTLSVSCSGSVHNVGVRRRSDGRLALGYARRGSRSYASVEALLRHHRKRRLLLVAGGGVVGATTLNEPPRYYQTPSSIPVPVRTQ